MRDIAEPGVVTFRPLCEEDLALLAQWLTHDHVQLWWRDSLAPLNVEQKYLPRIRGDAPTEVFMIVLDGRDVGMIQRYRIDDYPATHLAIAPSGHRFVASGGIDYLIGERELLGRGIGTTVIADFTAKLFAEWGDVDWIVVTPQAENQGSCRVLEKSGYQRLWVGLLDSDDPSDAGPTALYALRRPFDAS